MVYLHLDVDSRYSLSRDEWLYGVQTEHVTVCNNYILWFVDFESTDDTADILHLRFKSGFTPSQDFVSGFMASNKLIVNDPEKLQRLPTQVYGYLGDSNSTYRLNLTTEQGDKSYLLVSAKDSESHGWELWRVYDEQKKLVAVHYLSAPSVDWIAGACFSYSEETTVNLERLTWHKF